MSTSEPEGWTISEYKSFKVTGDDDSGSSSDGDSDDEEEQIFAKSQIVRKPKYKKIVHKEELLPEWKYYIMYNIKHTMADMTAQALNTVNLVTQELETQSLNAIVAGFSFAAAMSWMDLVRWIIQQVIKVPKNGGTQYTLTAILTTLLSIAVYMVVSGISTRVSKPAQPVFAITR